jgi:Protein of unknown function (DUF975)
LQGGNPGGNVSYPFTATPIVRRRRYHAFVEILSANLVNCGRVLSWRMGFSTGAAIRFGWETFKRRPWFFVGASLIIAVIYLLLGSLTSAIDTTLMGSPDDRSIFGSLVSCALGVLVGMGVTAFYLAAHDNVDTVALSELWHPQPFWKYLGASILLALAIAVGFILLIVPGIIFALMFMFTTFIVVDRELGPIEAMKESNRITRGYKWSLLGLVLMFVLINLLGVLALGVGLLVSLPVSSLAFVHAYRQLSGRAVPDAVMPPRAA